LALGKNIKYNFNDSRRNGIAGIAVFFKPFHILCYGVFYQDVRFPGSKWLLIASILANVLLVDFGASCFPAPKENEAKRFPCQSGFCLCFVFMYCLHVLIYKEHIEIDLGSSPSCEQSL